jgi:hypothetical protein
MSPIAIGLIVLAFILGGALFGVFMRAVIPEEHLNSEAKEAVKLGTGLIATMTALVLGLVTASAKNSFDSLDQGIKHAAANILALDRILARYGPETNQIRASLRRVVAWRHDTIWPPATTPETSQPAQQATIDPFESTPALEGIAGQISALAPQNDAQRWLRTQALNRIEVILKVRWLAFGDGTLSIPIPFLVALVFWLTVLFASFGLFAPRNATVLIVLFVCALSVSSAIFLILEMDRPFDGIIRVSDAPIRYALSYMNQ